MGRVRSRQGARRQRHRRVRARVAGNAERPRLSVFRSARHIRAQIVDDEAGHTLAAASTLDSQLEPAMQSADKTGKARAVGRALAERAQNVGVTRVVFDRGGYQFHGRVRALAEGAREGGLVF
ncbi:MAG: 50S ribosomal protein L18 [Anaerolineae bacterium]